MTGDRALDLHALAAQPLDETDVALLRAVAAEHEARDGAPPGLVDRLQFGVTLDALQAEVARLQRTDGLVGARGGDAANVQTVTFSTEHVSVMVTVSPAGPDRVRIDGWAPPGGGISVKIRMPALQLDATADSDGRFVFAEVPRGLAKFVIRHASQPPFVTPYIEL
ncbi:MAG: carboxypeptidase regulatory-like domain-containing protein [Jatrophihabitans sp.]|uniref:carboxypeptidase regulatory-like domain-containing protein n=1 Tax=Jatrophihabitans sp. TaxID=1932789 RepID=UPI00391034E3